MALIDRVCLGCGCVYGKKEGGGETKPTHGYCDPCYAIVDAEVDAYFATREAVPAEVKREVERVLRQGQ